MVRQGGEIRIDEEIRKGGDIREGDERVERSGIEGRGKPHHNPTEGYGWLRMWGFPGGVVADT